VFADVFFAEVGIAHGGIADCCDQGDTRQFATETIRSNGDSMEFLSERNSL